MTVTLDLSDLAYMSGRSVWAFTVAIRRWAVVTARTDQTRIFYRACEMKE